MNQIIAGVDEVGVGPIAGPVVAAAVILNPQKKIYKLKDSKMLTAAEREHLYDRIIEKALAVSIGKASVKEIDELNIFHATLLAMQRAIENLSLTPTLILVDGRSCPKTNVRVEAIVRGDQLVKSISAASIIAKVTRDREMRRLGLEFPEYNFQKHKGYSTKEHQALLWEHGPSIVHRNSFTLVKKVLAAKQLACSNQFIS